MHRKDVLTILSVLAVLGAGFGWNQARADASPKVETQNPHGSYREECSLCHGESGWKPARISRKFRHERFGFPLEGSHAIDCRACHESLEFRAADTACVSCHEDVHRGEVGQDCARCHSARSFIDRVRMVQAHRVTRFPLAGAHAGVDCERCHRSDAPGQLQYVVTQVECEDCHRADYEAARNPNHVVGGFSFDCRRCHTMLAWLPGRFDHGTTQFPLTGAHRALDCASCHTGNDYAAADPACVTCHLEDFVSSTNPDHAAQGWPTTCADCHGTSSWGGSFAQHDAVFFPIYSGAHRGKWSSCATCHLQSSDFSVHTCLGCHPHSDQQKTDGAHTGVSGYQYESAACYTCHPRGRH